MAEGATLGPGAELAGRYRLERLLGAGGMATVWLAEDRKLGRQVALKALSDTLLADPAYVARFEREARVAAGLLDPHLVKVFDYGSAGGRPYLVMEFVPGPTLAALIASDDPALDPERLAGELLGALRKIHDVGVIHRDVKPSNVLLDSAGAAKLTDFGIARPADATQLTQTGQVIGTLAYMAPEVKEGGEADARSDLYSLGVILRECARGGASASLLALIDRLTAAAPQDRPASAEAALGILETARVPEATLPTTPMAAATGGGQAAADPTLARPAAALRRRQALALLLAAAAVIVILILVLGSGGGGAGGSHSDATHRQANQGATTAPESSRQAPAPPAEPAAPVTCDEIQSRLEALGEQRKAAEESVGHDKEAKKQVEESFKAREEALKEREKSCSEGDSGGGDAVPPGLEKKGKPPPGQAKKD